jgi:G6PDH family F420-dependent oxidoreductase
MTSFGYTLMGEEHGPRELVTCARRAEELGFDFVVAADHCHPWVPEQRHSSFVWSVLGAVALATDDVELATMVTCPTMRYHPVVLAQMAATVGVMSEGRFTLGVGAGERLNEHVVGRGWPAVSTRHEMLGEAVEIVRALWQGGYVTRRGRYFTVEDARVFDLPARPIPVAVAASGRRSGRLAGQIGDGLICTQPLPDVVEEFRAAGEPGRPVWGQIACCWGSEPDEALRLAHERFRWSALGWKVQAELPNPVNFDAAARTVRPEDLSDSIPCGPDPQPYLDAVAAFTGAGFDRVAFVQIGDDQDGFFRFWQDELQPALRSRELAAARA